MCPHVLTFPSSEEAERVGWKAFHLQETSGVISDPSGVPVEVPQGLVVRTTLFNDSIRQMLRDILLHMLQTILDRDEALRSRVESELGMSVEDIDAGNMEDAWELFIDSDEGKIGVSDTAGEASKCLAHAVAEVVQETIGRGDLDVNPILETGGFLYLRSSTYCPSEGTWLQYHTGGRFLSIPCHVEDLHDGIASKFATIYAWTLSSWDTVTAVLKSGTEDFSMGILVLPISPDIDTSGKVTTRADQSRAGTVVIDISAREGVDVAPSCLMEACSKLTIKDGDVWVSEMGEKLRIDTFPYAYLWEVSRDRLTRRADTDEGRLHFVPRQSARLVPDEASRKMGPHFCRRENSPLEEDHKRRLVAVTKMLFDLSNSSDRFDEYRHLCWEFAILVSDKKVQILQCDPAT